MSAHLVIAPILIPLITGAILLLLERTHSSRVQRFAAAFGTTLLLFASIALLHRASSGQIDVYLLGDWPGRLGITLITDRLGTMMVFITSLLAIPCLLHASAGWDKRALHFHALFQLQLVGLNGAFLTGDIFNLFVFFEVMLIASYGLLLSGARGPRIKAGLHYVVFNIAASTLFLMALGLLYGMIGSLNMTEMAARIAAAPPEDTAMLKAAAGLLMVVFCAKAALLPLYMWLPETYSRAPAAVAALFAIMTKVGIYALLRTGTLMFGADAGALAGLAWPWLLPTGLATVALAAFGVVGATRLRTAIAYLVLLSAGTLFIALALHTREALTAAIYYLPHSTFVAAAMFLLADKILRLRGDTGEHLLRIAPMAGKAMLGTLFMISAVSIAGLPPLSGFIGKVLLLDATPAELVRWVWPIILVSSLLVIIALSRNGTRLFWRVEPFAADAQLPPAPQRKEVIAVSVLLAYGIVMTVFAQPIVAFADATAAQLLAPADYLQAVRETLPQLREPAP